MVIEWNSKKMPHECKLGWLFICEEMFITKLGIKGNFVDTLPMLSFSTRILPFQNTKTKELVVMQDLHTGDLITFWIAFSFSPFIHSFHVPFFTIPLFVISLCSSNGTYFNRSFVYSIVSNYTCISYLKMR